MRNTLFGLIILVFSTVCALAQDSQEATALARAMDAVGNGKWNEATILAAPDGQVAKDIVLWHRLRAGAGQFAEYIDFLDRRSDWPGLPLMRRRGEANILASASADNVITFFAEMEPQTGTGSLRLAAAYEKSGAPEKAQTEAVRAWRELSLSQSQEAKFLSTYGETLVNHHRARQDMLLWEGLTTEAARLNSLVGADYKALARARIGLIKKGNNLTALIKAVPAALVDDAGLAHARFEWRIKKGQEASAIELLLKHSTSVAALGRPDDWGNRRRTMARQMMRDGKVEMAYEIAANHHLEEGDNFIDLEWLAGFIALSDLNDPEKALAHFRRFRASVETPISQGRAGYWEGRAHEALGNGEAALLAYEYGAEYQTSFYGQLAAEKAGIEMDVRLTGELEYPDFNVSAHGQSSVLAAAILFQEAGHPLLFTRFTRHLAEILTVEERGSLAQLALDLDEPFAALYMAKYAAKSGDVLMRSYFPVTDVASSELSVPPELTLSIIRRESEFFPVITSPAGARGLMQLMPRTAKAMAKKLKVSFSVSRLSTDPVYNAQLGSAYLDELIDDMGPYYPFVAAGYNAGPSRPKNWARQYGDPRRSIEHAVDWVEHIPFRETRNYVMRVMESLAVYRARLSGEVSELRLGKDMVGG
ncbi:MAG: lytic transglycosylase domain-containing protein [Paracoccaceae bacterium]